MAITLGVHECLGDCKPLFFQSRGICWLCNEPGITKKSAGFHVPDSCSARICAKCADKEENKPFLVIIHDMADDYIIDTSSTEIG